MYFGLTRICFGWCVDCTSCCTRYLLVTEFLCDVLGCARLSCLSCVKNKSCTSDESVQRERAEWNGTRMFEAAAFALLRLVYPLTEGTHHTKYFRTGYCKALSLTHLLIQMEHEQYSDGDISAS